VIWLANDSQPGQLLRLFEQAVKTQDSNPISKEHKQVLSGDIPKICEGERNMGRSHDRFEGRAMIVTDKEQGLRDFCIQRLGLRSSVQFLRFSRLITRRTLKQAVMYSANLVLQRECLKSGNHGIK
jgi:hypothetical protein